MMKQKGMLETACGGRPDIDKRLQEMVSPLLGWYDSHARILPWRESPSPYAVWISEIMLQQTRVEAVKPYFDRWMKTFPTLSSLAGASEAEVLKLWEGLGYYSRVRNIHKTAKLVMEKSGGSLPSSFEGLRSLPGIGEYTAGSVGSIAFQLPVPCVDGNVLRVTARLTADPSDISAAAAKKFITEQIRAIIPEERPGDFNQAMMELGATVCLPNGLPRCGECPVSFLCEARRLDRVAGFPVKSGKPPRKIEKRTVLVLLNEKGTAAALRKRPESGLLASLWEFPNFDGVLSEDEMRQILDASCLNISSLVKLKGVRHVFTHIEWDMTGYLAVIKGRDPGQASAVMETDSSCNNALDFQWIDIKLMDEKLALPAAFKSYYQVLKGVAV
jgi:A/G-specific adenine glycosylase